MFIPKMTCSLTISNWLGRISVINRFLPALENASDRLELLISVYLKNNIIFIKKIIYLCHLLITFANSLDPDQARQNVGPDLDPNCLTL